MNKLIMQVDYNEYLVCSSIKDEQELLRILSSAKIVKTSYEHESFVVSDKSPTVKMIDSDLIAAEEPVKEEE